MKKLKFIFVILVFHNFSAQTSMLIGNTTVQVETIYTGLDIPWEIKFGPDENIWLTERSGLVSKIDPISKTRTVLLDLSNQIYAEAEAGLLGLSLHPDFTNNPYVFLAYTYGAFPTIKERIVRYTFENNSLNNETIILDEILGNSTHNGCRLFFLPDTTLLISTGDVQSPSFSQNLNSLNGKILRINADGTIPTDNPNPLSPIYAYGFRNVQGIAASHSGRIFVSEHGASTDDEFQVLEVNRNYGWPNVEGFCNSTGEQTFCNTNNVKEPLLAWTPTIAPSDMIFYQNQAFPEFHNKMLMTVLKDKKLVAIEFNEDESQVLNQTHYLSNQFGRLRDICIGSNKEIYLATNGSSWSNTDPFTHSIIRLTPPNDLSLIEKSFSDLKIYPNPTNELINFDENLFSRIDVFSMDGKQLCSHKIVNNQNQIYLEKLSKGTYLLEFIRIDRQKERIRIVKN